MTVKYLIDKWQLLRFDWLIASALLLVAMCTGELAGLIRWEFLGYQYFPGNFFNRALPYVLLGAFIYRKMAFFGAVERPWYIGGIVLGVFLSVVEMLLLAYFGVPGYYGHLIGMGVIAGSVCLLAFQDDGFTPGFEAVFGMSRWHVNCIYYLAQPVSIVIAFLLSSIGKEVFAMSVNFMGIFTFIVCFFLSWLIACISRLLQK